MASVRRTAAGSWELCLTHRLLPRRRYFTFDTEEQALEYGRQADALLQRGVVPDALRGLASSTSLAAVLRAWLATGQPAPTDRPVLELLIEEQGKQAMTAVTLTWARNWVLELKVKRNLAPGTIRKRVASLRRALDWHLTEQPDLQWSNPLHLLSADYSTYRPLDQQLVRQAGGKIKRDVQRDRRLAPGELERIMAALAGHKREGRQRALRPDPAFTLLFQLLLHTGLRLREAYRLRCDAVDLARRVLTADSSKQRNDHRRPRHVPIRPELHALLVPWLEGRVGLVFPWWDGSPAQLPVVTSRLSARFAALFAYAGCEGLTEHDLRHEATCRWLEASANGSWLFRKEEVASIMGWAPGSRMLERYASFRAEDLAARLWPTEARTSAHP